MHQFTDRFMAAFVRSAQRAAAESDPLTREMQMAALAASALSRLTSSELFDDGERRTAMLVARLITTLRLEVQDSGQARRGEDALTSADPAIATR